ncbi:MAG: nitroreductase family protein [Chloroflexi bacterium]|nr:nitroreductase family protein [Chloroflexota bacterium]
MLRELVEKNRSYRRFRQEINVDRETLRGLVDLARLSASAGNTQPLRYVLSCDARTNALIFPNLAWARYLGEWPGPAEGERPSAYIVVLEDTRLEHPLHCDHGIAAQSILLGAVEKGFGGCIIGSVNKPKLRQALNIPDRYEVLLVLALGQPKEEVVIEGIPPDGSLKYWRDDRGVHHVPKRTLDDLILQLPAFPAGPQAEGQAPT